jgi:tRNA-dihydrouridine synthase
MGDAAYAAEVVRMTVRSTSLPVSVKLRAGHQNDLSYLLRFVSGLQDAGASWITLHPRTTEQKRRGSADWSQIRVVRESLSIPVIGNGDVQTVDDVLSLRESTGCDLVMIGRALTARPWLLWQLGERLGFEAPVAAGDARRAPVGPVEEGAEYGRSLRRLLALMQEHFTEELGLRKFRFYVKTGAPWLLFGHDLHARTTKARTWVEMDSMLEEFFSREQPMSVRTELRQ